MARLSVCAVILGLVSSGSAVAVTIDKATFFRYGGHALHVSESIRDRGVLDQLREYSYAKPWLGVSNMLFGSRICTATWIGEDERWSYILTAAHCFVDFNSVAMPTSQTFRISRTDVSATFLGSSWVIAEGSGTVYVPHERTGARPLDPATDFMTDIAVVKLPRRMTPVDDFGEPLEKPILNDSMSGGGEPFVVVGYGLWGWRTM